VDPSTAFKPAWPRDSALSLAVVVATTGRPRTSRRTIERLARQTKPADRIVVVGVTPADIAEFDHAAMGVETYLGPKGSCHQRNYGLDLLEGTVDLVVFLDDDFLPADDYFAQTEVLFLENPGVAAVTGRVIADGVHGPGISFEDAEAAIAADAYVLDRPAPVWTMSALYGCNMAVRMNLIGDLRFDENLPLYAWQEDIDYSFRAGARGRLAKCVWMAGVHMGEKAGRTSGRRFGYSQIANPLYLLKKGTMPRDLAWRNVRNNVAANVRRSVKPEPYIDRRGRLAGNLAALRDLLTGRIDPARILDMG